ncbi:3' terminal RNA ribose 2'-O-methyltransferase Hen1 [Planococcus sp. CP5-4]|uniref:3' terminal RNA ribose 2'-O-methyltransferase Hen1 n=1 Tax=unclassified Planococcus (in: firmicutes) TaxID=2662419 RepID=UPI001C23BE4B|nr:MULTISPECIES: 3' terminal RNA ribose 2'-O-methyltransferase Hen1 [unclassified Planococcus (in: firmicutes)]MBU9675012.1 3' terminal RNA ribose 2'-O-methyltransferase Hen1 [Planococcus sp. CP5-4_YE]MBV0910362.1 3' terminal RNA ribose 2'-O-methyltransferase Hen1 [Planococcus sp. CP5-4_UN]MBW6063862.1 3' terminal RNA ribose 2'-O-methyltransferase Hen1 [Planococcus sp. CP5-4]
MQLTIRTTGDNVKAVSYLLAKNPNNLYERNQKGHMVRMFYSKFTDKELEMTIFVTPDPIEMSQNGSNSYDITHYINDREFAVSSIFLSMIRSALGTALNGQPKEEYTEWVTYSFPFTFELGPVNSSLSDQQLIALFEPMDYQVQITRPEIQYSFQLKEKSTVRMISLTGEQTLQNALRHLFVLIPVIDDYKHYYIDEKEIEKISRYGEGWLESHTMRETIYRRALRFKEVYSLVENGNGGAGAEKTEVTARVKGISLNELRYTKISETAAALKPKSIVDFGSGEGKLAVKLGFIDGVEEILAVEPSQVETMKAVRRFDKVEDKENFVEPETLWGSLYYFDERLKEKDLMILCEVIEHIDEPRLPKAFDLILHHYAPKSLIVTTPNREYNEVYDMDDHFRHADHRFEWTRQEFRNWCKKINYAGLYEIEFAGIGEEHPEQGCPTQMCVFKRKVAI